MHATKLNWMLCAMRSMLMIALAGLFLLMLTACSASRPLVETEVVTKVVEKYRDLPSKLTEPAQNPKPPTEPMTWLNVAELALQWKKVALAEQAKLAKIRGIQHD